MVDGPIIEQKVTDARNEPEIAVPATQPSACAQQHATNPRRCKRKNALTAKLSPELPGFFRSDPLIHMDSRPVIW
jgi:hypothetical protein